MFTVITAFIVVINSVPMSLTYLFLYILQTFVMHSRRSGAQ